MNLPKNPQEAAAQVVAKAKREGVSVSAYCLLRGISPAVIYNWQTRNKHFDGGIFERLMRDAAKLKDKQRTGSLRK